MGWLNVGGTEENKPSDPAMFELKKFVVSLDDIQQMEEGAVNIPPPMPDHPLTDYVAPLETSGKVHPSGIVWHV